MDRFVAKIIISLSMIFTLLSCESHHFGDAEEADLDGTLVVEGWIDAMGYPVVILTQVLTPSSEPIPIVESLVRWGKVTISDGENTVLLPGGIDKNNFPLYSYRSYEIKGIQGREYTITAEYHGRKVTARSKMLEVPEICGIEFGGEENDSLRTVTVSFRHSGNDTGYYVAFTRDLTHDPGLLPALMGTVIADKGRDHVYKMSLLRGKTHFLDEDYTSKFEKGAQVEMVLAQVEKEVYDYYEVYNDMVLFGNSLFINSNKKLISNVDGGFGIWSARAGVPLKFRVQ